MSRNTFSDLQFQGMNSNNFTIWSSIPDHAKGFRLWATTATGSNEQNFHFTRCVFSYLNNVFETAGDNTTSENSWVQCEMFRIKGSALSLNNLQSFNHEYHSTHMTEMFGNVFATPTAGGSIKVYGGSVIMESDSGSDTYYFTGTNANAGVGGFPILFSGVRMELRGQHTNLINVNVNITEFDVHFNDCMFEDQVTATKANWVQVGPYSTVEFRNCSWLEINGGQVNFTINNGAIYGESGAIIFETCALPIDWSDRINISTVGLVSARNCRGLNVGAPAAGAHWAHDFDFHWGDTAGQVANWTNTPGITADGSPTDLHWRLKIAPIKLTSDSWKDEQTLKLPRNSIIKNIHLRMPGGGGDGTVITWSVNRNDKSGTPHLTSNSAASSAVHTGDTTNYFYHVSSTTNERTLRLYPSTTVTGNAIRGGLCVVEYY